MSQKNTNVTQYAEKLLNFVYSTLCQTQVKLLPYIVYVTAYALLISDVRYRDFLYPNIKHKACLYHNTIYVYIYISRYTYASSTPAYDLQCKKLSTKICYETITFITCIVLIIQLIWQLNTY